MIELVATLITTRVRAATSADVPSIVAMGERFVEAEYAAYLRLDGVSIAAYAQYLIGGGGVVFIAERDMEPVGMMALTTYQQPMSGERVASEVVWWMDEDARGGLAALRFVKAAKQWAREQGATRLDMVAPSDRLCRFYEQIGMSKVETHYQWDLR